MQPVAPLDELEASLQVDNRRRVAQYVQEMVDLAGAVNFDVKRSRSEARSWGCTAMFLPRCVPGRALSEFKDARSTEFVVSQVFQLPGAELFCCRCRAGQPLIGLF